MFTSKRTRPPNRPVEPELADDERVQALCRALATCDGDQELVMRFLRDLLSARELLDMSNRWTAARQLIQGKTQLATAQELGMSTKTINEIAAWVYGLHATGGYWEVARRTDTSTGG